MIVQILYLILIYTFYRLLLLVQFVRQVRTSYHDLPSFPRHWFWGNLVNCGQRLVPSKTDGRHPDYALEELWQELGQPPAFLLDLAPVDEPMLIITEPHIAEQLVQPSTEYKYSAPKLNIDVDVKRIFGEGSLVSVEGEEWKTLRRRFNKGFAPNHIHSLSPLVVDKTRTFVKRLQALAEDGGAQPMRIFAQDLTTDIITQLTIMEDLQCQEMPEGQGAKSVFGMLTASRILSTLVYDGGLGINLESLLSPVRYAKGWFYEKVYDYHVRRILVKRLNLQNKSLIHKPEDSKQALISSASPSGGPGRSVTELALAGMQPSRGLIENTVSQIKTFIFAGQDTTATTIQWCLYELSKASPEIRDALESEHNNIFGKADPFSGLDVLTAATASQSENILNSKLPFTTAFIKETLRLHPPAATARSVPRAGSKLSFTSQPAPPVYIDFHSGNTKRDTTQNESPIITTNKTKTTTSTGTKIRIDGIRTYTPQHLLHRNPQVWGPTAHTFDPFRFLDEAYLSSIPTGAFRPFERGPRNCIGQDLAMNELKIVMVAVTRAFEFTKVGLDGKNGSREVYSVYNLTAVPADGMVMSVKLRL